MIKTLTVTLLAAVGCYAADLAQPNQAGVAWGHFHFRASDMEKSKAFWTTLGATPAKPLGASAVFLVKNAVIVLMRGEVAGGTETTVVHHVGFKVKDLDGTIAKAKAAGYRLLTPPETTAKTHKANFMGPDEVNVELVGDPSLEVAMASHHVHFYNDPIDGTKAWYVKTFSAIPGKRDIFEAADIPGINLSFSAAKGTPVGTKGRALDHIGFEVKDLEGFCKKLEAAGVKFDVPFRKVPAIGLSIAFFTDPWGAYIELTEGLDKLQ